MSKIRQNKSLREKTIDICLKVVRKFFKNNNTTKILKNIIIKRN